jgi:hypothetical protein
MICLVFKEQLRFVRSNYIRITSQSLEVNNFLKVFKLLSRHQRLFLYNTTINLESQQDIQGNIYFHPTKNQPSLGKTGRVSSIIYTTNYLVIEMMF